MLPWRGSAGATTAFPFFADAPGVPSDEVFKGVFDMVAVGRHGRPVPISPTVQNQETRP